MYPAAHNICRSGPMYFQSQKKMYKKYIIKIRIKVCLTSHLFSFLRIKVFITWDAAFPFAILNLCCNIFKWRRCDQNQTQLYTLGVHHVVVGTLYYNQKSIHCSGHHPWKVLNTKKRNEEWRETKQLRMKQMLYLLFIIRVSQLDYCGRVKV